MKNKIVIEGSVAYISITQGFTSVIDKSDVELISKHRWRALVTRRKDGPIRAVYVVTSARRDDGTWKTICLHRLLMNPPDDMDVDHASGDGLDNRRCNLRICSHTNNIRNQRLRSNNTSGYKGVNLCKDRAGNNWHAQIWHDNKKINLGYYSTPELAAHAYNVAVVELFGAFARPNQLAR
jgi:hypothetical protein